MSTAVQTREVLSKLEGVCRVHPFGHNGKALVFVTEKDKFTEEAANKALIQGTKDLRVRKMVRAKA
jgi:hypothetical protein